MKNTDFSMYNNFYTAVILLDSSNRVVFKNVQFVKAFGNIKNLEKFSNYFSFNICVLDSENILNSNPINFALNSAESFTASAVYQKTKEQFYQITSFFTDGYKLIAFKDNTMDTLYEETEKKYDFLWQKYIDLIEENKSFASSRVRAQNQAIKLALLHRISNVIRESMDISKIIDAALKELFNLFGAIKVYYASNKDNEFILQHTYPSKFKNSAGEKIQLEDETNRSILSKNIKISSCIKDYLNSETTYSSPINRIVIPIYQLHNILGILIIYSGQKNIAESQNDVLQSIASQLASAIVQASLFTQIKQKNDELENTLTELKETQLQLINSEKMASLGQLVAGVAHEINTPLASINANNNILSKLIKKMPENPENEIFHENMESINNIDKEAIKRISQIVQSLKKFVRLDESDLQYANINKELDLTLELIKHETRNRIKINRNYGEIPRLKCYPNMLNQVFMNILINACHSIEDDGEISIKTELKDENLFVKIKDTGTGIDERIRDRLFVAGTTTKEIGIGTGLGLAISHKIVKKHNGNISFTTQKNKGTEFVIEIPVISD